MSADPPPGRAGRADADAVPTPGTGQPSGPALLTEAERVAARYARRGASDRYSPLRPEVMMWLHERQQALRELMSRAGIGAVDGLALVEVGCGGGDNLLELLRLGFDPARLVGIELLPARAEQARRRLPASLQVLQGDATDAGLGAASQDLVLQSTVFSSLLDDGAQQRLAGAMWRWLRPGGAIVWYDFTVDNPRNPDVRGVPVARIRALFPEGRMAMRRITLAPPLARAAVRVHPLLAHALNRLPFLRTHVLAWIAKPR